MQFSAFNRAVDLGVPIARACFFFMIAVTSLLLGLRQSYSQEPLLSPKKVTESFEDSIRPTSGGIVVGVMADDAADPQVTLDQLRIFVPQGPWHTLNIELTAIDGSYDGTFEYDLPTPQHATVVRVLVASAKPDRLRRFRATQLAVMATLSSASPSDRASAVSSWTTAISPAKIAVLLNKRDWDAGIDLLDATDNVFDHAICEAIPGDSKDKVAYDTRCVVTVPASPRIRASVVRWHYDSSAKSIPLRILMP